MPAKILQPGEIESFSAAIPRLILPDAHTFKTRAERLRRIAPGHGLGDYLTFVAAIADWQQTAFDALTDLAPPDAAHLDQCATHGFPPLAPQGLARDPRWRELVRDLAGRLGPSAPAQARAVLEGIANSNDVWIEEQAEALLALDLARVDIAASAIIAAALQVYWSLLAQTLEASRIARPAFPNLCPVCGSHPVASVVRIGGVTDALRYLVCSLCDSHWYLERAKCSNCNSTRQIGYHAVENPESAIRAESCPECRSYLKILYQNQTPDLEPTADDLASLALDWLMSEEGYGRSGVNLMLLQGGSLDGD
ncbi:formate dehydrogenase accessory protein FdhE [Thiocystis violacea]|uniref:formate dehydrogenase accessory protein FdhE n=1 Tax=Thiocystis violacea TaxID=13725 RepID=UPI00190451C8|nr:formate dehydrogenase accessory protein FdhE [Thiocystis violacea]MBK1718325.1 formate dehydrogenase accessory protein FdhE [Thiocystis violacea]